MKIYRNIKIRDWVGTERQQAALSKVGHVLRNNAPTLALSK